MKQNVILYIAMSSDGFIADKNGGVSWLDPYSQDMPKDIANNYYEFWQSIDCVAMGRKTYEQMLTFGDWPNVGKKTYVFTESIEKPMNEDIAFVCMDVKNFIVSFEEKFLGHRIWLEGGADLIQQFSDADLINQYIITIIPVKLYEGIPLPISIMMKNDIKLVRSTIYSNQIIQKHYVIGNDGL